FGLERGTSPIILTYDALDAEGDRIDLRADIAPVGTGEFVPIQEFPLPISEGLIALSASAEGQRHTLVLDPAGVQWPAQAVEVRLTVSDGFPTDEPRTTETIFSVPSSEVGLVSNTFVPQTFERAVDVFGTVMADVDGDGRDDLVFAEDAGSFERLRVFPSRGTSLEANSNSNLFGGAASDVDGCDIDNDEREEVFVRSGGTLLFYDGDADARLSFSQNFTTGLTNPIASYFADANGDGECDIVSLDLEQVSVRLGNGSGTFAAASVGDFNPPENFFDPIVAADVDGDGSAEFFNFAFAPDRIEIWDGDIDDLSSFVQIDDAVATLPASLTSADLDGNGADEVIVGQNDVIRILTENPAGVPLVTTVSFIDSPGANVDVSAGDIDGDALLDLVARTSSELRVFRGRGDLTFEPLVTIPISTDQRTPRVGDIDGDGSDDIGLTDRNTDTLYVYRNERARSGLTQFNEVLPEPFLADARAAAVGDLNRDGLPDIAAVRLSFSGVTLFLSLSERGIATPGFVRRDIDLQTPQTSVGIQDFDEDGYPEIVVRDIVSETLTVISDPLGTPAFEQIASIAAPGTSASFSRESVMQLTDLTDDGVKDVVLQVEQSVRVFRGARPLEDLGAIDLSGVLLSSQAIGDIAVGRIDPDALTDLAVLTTDNTLRVYFADGDGGTLTARFGAPETRSVDSADEQLAIADMSQDGSPNILVPVGTEVRCFEAITAATLSDCDAGGSESITNTITLSAWDYNDDGAPDLIYQETSDPLFVRLQERNGARPSGQFTTLSSGSFGDTSITVRFVDLTGDGVDDLIFAGADSDDGTDGGVLRVQPGSRAASLSQTRFLRDFADDDSAIPLSTRLPAALRPETTLIVRISADGTSLGETVPDPSLTAISTPMTVVGESRFVGVPANTPGVVPAGVRRGAVVPRLGMDNVTTVGGIPARSGLSVSDGRTVTFELPITAGSITQGEVRVFRARKELRRASDYPEDPMVDDPRAPLLLPVLDVAGEPRTVVERYEVLEEIGTEAGSERFLLDTRVNPPVLRITVERLGTFRAYRTR
ncbi:MAG: VCBS repeat-containing protein, partial [Myxococcota bacterium]